MEGFNCARTLVAAACIGAAEKALEWGIGYIKERHAFSSPLAQFEGMQFQLAERSWGKSSPLTEIGENFIL